MRYLAAGTGKVHIGSCRKMGSTSLQFLCESNESITLKRYNSSFRDNTFVILLRDVNEKWKSGTVTDCPYEAIEYLNYTYMRWGDQRHFVGKVDKDGKRWLDDNFLDEIAKYHSVTSDLSWMWKGDHTKFWEWYSPHEADQTEISLLEFSKFENIYFLELKELSNPKFLKWLQERDSEWKSIEEIPHKNETPISIDELKVDNRDGIPYSTASDMKKKFIGGYNEFWKLYQNGKILKDKNLANPFFDLPGNDLVDELKSKINLAKNEQLVVDNIRKYSKRYIKL